MPCSPRGFRRRASWWRPDAPRCADTIELTRHALCAGLRALPGAAAVLLQGPDRRRRVHRYFARLIDARRPMTDCGLPVSHPAGLGFDAGPTSSARLAAASRHHRGRQGRRAATGRTRRRCSRRRRSSSILVGHEPDLPRLMRAGGAGTICGIANTFPESSRPCCGPTSPPGDEARIACAAGGAVPLSVHSCVQSDSAPSANERRGRVARAAKPPVKIALKEADQHASLVAAGGWRAAGLRGPGGGGGEGSASGAEDDALPDRQSLEALRAFDTPTICNALEIVTPRPAASGFNRRPLVAPFPELKPVVGFARTALIRSREPHPRIARQRHQAAPGLLRAHRRRGRCRAFR